VAEGQLGLFNEAEALAEEAWEADTAAEAPDTVEVPAHTRRRGKRAPLPEHLPRVDIVHELPEAERVCPHDGGVLERFAEELTEQLDIIPAKVQVLRHRRAKYRCACCGEHLVTAPLPTQPVPKSQASPGLLAYVATSKYVDALPLYRQAKSFTRIGLDLPRQTLARWMLACGELVWPLINLYRDALLALPYVHADETTVQVLKEPGRSATSKSYLWCQASGIAERPIVLFDYDPSRASTVPQRLLAGFAGYLHTDGYEGYNALVRENAITQLYCFAHARRYFVDGLKGLGLNPAKLPPKPPDKARRLLRGLEFIGTLYAIERRIRDKPPDARYAIRQRESVAVLERLREWVNATLPRVPPGTALGKALGYLDNHWDGLVRFLEDGRLEIDNNRAENAIRPFVVGRRNWLFSDTPGGATASANLYSLVETAKANGLDPYAYLRHVFTTLPQATTVADIEALLAWNLDPRALNPDTP
jgi:transposase